ncbi:MAG TPA: 50S ribosomal protein L6 [Candidatus Hydrothermia bacterium]|nr:50S ribosomal protein L6 [Candidatus Hydrothermae bacterium]MDD3648939.1 50S ribosomal protein L6 [Candidatus Hydrothermia bacterium]MDD5573405.1 50S ribosomal protein L6 [Candidatus Hydrothermia bacterium]HOK23180.1 50S ribosomal protein L6 [Candidatus Hydrothermia bacterium]HOL23884.1 50S ribosomal protein L6 [Candidatus Hydrothermia bacterium]
MSRIGKKPIEIPKGVEVKVEGKHIKVTGPKGNLETDIHPDMSVKIDGGEVLVDRPSDRKFHRALHGTTRQLISNMIEGVTKGYIKELEVAGTGYRARVEGNKLLLSVGYSNPVEIDPPAGVEFEVEGQNIIKVKGIDKCLVGNVAASIRKIRPPEPYKGKGIRYRGEIVRRKAGKTSVKAGGK